MMVVSFFWWWKKKEKPAVLFIGTNQKVVLVAGNFFSYIFFFSLALEICALCVKRHHLTTTLLLFRMYLRHDQVLSTGYNQLGMSCLFLFHFVNHCNILFFLEASALDSMSFMASIMYHVPNACSEPCWLWLKCPVLSKLLHLLYVGVVIKLTEDSTYPRCLSPICSFPYCSLSFIVCLCWQVHQIRVAQGFPNFLALEEPPWHSICGKEPLIICLSGTREKERSQKAPQLTPALTQENGYTRLIFAQRCKGWIGRIVSSLAIVKKRPHRWTVTCVSPGAHGAPGKLCGHDGISSTSIHTQSTN